MITKNSKIYIAGHRGMVGSACWRLLKSAGYKNIIGKTSNELDLRDQKAVENFIKTEKPDAIIDAAAKVGGILANKTSKAEFIYQNLMIQTNLIHSSYLAGVKKLILLGSSCVYPKFAKQPIKESYLLSGALEETNDAYAVAKIAGIKMCESYNNQYNLNYMCLISNFLFFSA